MATRIRETPKLVGKDAANFRNMLVEKLTNPRPAGEIKQEVERMRIVYEGIVRATDGKIY